MRWISLLTNKSASFFLLPIHWTKHENNNSGFNLTILARIEPASALDAQPQHYAVLAPHDQNKENV